MTISFQIGLWMIALGCLPGSVAWLTLVRRLLFVKKAQTTVGVVEEIIFQHTSDGHSYSPKIAFTTQTGEKVVLPSHRGYSTPRFQIGQEVPVVYDPSRPHRAHLRAFESLWVATLVFGIIGSFIFLSGVLLLIIDKN